MDALERACVRHDAALRRAGEVTHRKPLAKEASRKRRYSGLTDEERAFVAAVCAQCPALAQARRLVGDFARLLERHDAAALGFERAHARLELRHAIEEHHHEREDGLRLLRTHGVELLARHRPRPALPASWSLEWPGRITPSTPGSPSPTPCLQLP